MTPSFSTGANMKSTPQGIARWFLRPIRQLIWRGPADDDAGSSTGAGGTGPGAGRGSGTGAGGARCFFRLLRTRSISSRDPNSATRRRYLGARNWDSDEHVKQNIFENRRLLDRRPRNFKQLPSNLKLLFVYKRLHVHRFCIFR